MTIQMLRYFTSGLCFLMFVSAVILSYAKCTPLQGVIYVSLAVVVAVADALVSREIRKHQASRTA